MFLNDKFFRNFWHNWCQWNWTQVLVYVHSWVFFGIGTMSAVFQVGGRQPSR
jgi:hypothetical protein